MRLIADVKQPEYLVRIHPNDGFDLGFMTYSYKVTTYNNCSADDFNKGTAEHIDIQLDQANECGIGTIEVSSKLASRLGYPDMVKLIHHNDKLLILNLT